MRIIAHDAPWGPDKGLRGGELYLALAEAGVDREAEMTDQRDLPRPRNGIEITLSLREPPPPGLQCITLWRDSQLVQTADLKPTQSWHQWHDVLVRVRRDSITVQVDGRSLGRSEFSTAPGVPHRTAFMNVFADIDIADFRIIPLAAGAKATP
jgi:hypothetical protein